MPSSLSLVENKLRLECSYNDRHKAKAVSGYRWNKDKKTWDYPISYDAFLSLKQAFSDLQIEPAIKIHFQKQTEELNKSSAFKKNPTESPVLETIPLKSKPYGHQRTGISFLLNQNCSLLCDEMGLGKSYQAMVTAIARRNAGEVSRVLVLCPATIKGVWLSEVLKHTYEKAVMVEGTKAQREKQYKEYDESGALFLVMNYETLRCDPPPIKFDMVICDESVRIKNPKAQITKRVKKMPAIYKVGLSGYPVANRVEDIWSQIDWVKPGYLGSRWQFEDKYMIKQTIVLKDSREFKQVMGYQNLKELQAKLTPLYIRRLKSQVLDLPEKVRQVREVELTKEQMDAYVRMKEEMRVMLTDMDEREVHAKARTILVQLLRLSQITGGFITDVSWEKPVWLKTSAKLTELDTLVDEVIASGNKVVLWSRFVPMVLALHERYKKYNAVYLTGSVKVEDRTKMIEQFQTDKDVGVFVGQVQSGGMGITLHAANTEIFVDKAFISPSSVLQAEDRLHRIGQKKTVVIITLVAKNTVDAHWERLIARKIKLAEQLLGDAPGWDLKKSDLMDMVE